MGACLLMGFVAPFTVHIEKHPLRSATRAPPSVWLLPNQSAVPKSLGLPFSRTDCTLPEGPMPLPAVSVRTVSHRLDA